MELRHLRYFVAVAEELHFGKAAWRLHISQSPLNQQIRLLEEELGVALFRRTGRQIILTEEGRLFLEQARLILAQMSKAIDLVQPANSGQAGQLSIGMMPAAAYRMLPLILREFRRLHPKIDLHCYNMLPPLQIEGFVNRQIDIGFVRTTCGHPEIDSLSIAQERLVLAVNESHWAAGKESVDLRDLAGDVFLRLSRAINSSYYDWMREVYRNAGFTPSMREEEGDADDLLTFVAAGFGVSVMPESVRFNQRAGVVYVDLPNQTETVNLSIAWRKDQPNPAIAPFIEVARKVATTWENEVSAPRQKQSKNPSQN